MSDPYGLSASELPPELIAQLVGSQGQKAIAEAMLRQSMQPLEAQQAKGRFQGVVSPLEAIAKLVQGGVARGNIADSNRQMGEIARQQRDGVQSAMQKYQQMREGTPAKPMISDDFEGAPATIDAVKGDPLAAFSYASTDPRIAKNKVIDAQLKAWEKGQEPFSLRQGENRYVGSNVVAANAPKESEHVIDGKIYGTGGGKVREIGGPGPKVDYNKPFLPDGTANKEYQAYELYKANQGATRVQTNVNAFTPASEEAQRDFIKSTRATFDTLKQAPVALASIEKAKELIPEAKSFMGPGGEGMLDAAKFLNNRLGMNINTEGVKSAEELRTRIFFNIMDNLKKMDAQPSLQQQQIMQQALGNLGTDPNALPNVLDAFADSIRGRVALHNNEVDSAQKRGVKFPYDPIINVAPKGAVPEGSDVKKITSDAEYNALKQGEKYISPDGKIRMKS